MPDYAMFEVDVTFREEATRRDVDGWVRGYGPGNGQYGEPVKRTFRVVCRREGQARERAMSYFDVAGIKDLTVAKVRKTEIDALIFEIP